MPTTIAINDKVHLMILKKQTKLFENGRKLKMAEIVEECVVNWIDKV